LLNFNCKNTIIKMKNILNSFLFLLIVPCAFGQFSTPGTGVSWSLNDLVTYSGGVMTYENSKFFLWNGLTISQNDTVSITTDEEVRIGLGIEITVHGTLLTNPPANILFSAMDTTANFNGLTFNNSDVSRLVKTTIEFGGGIKLIDSNIVLDSCIIRKNNQSNCSGAIDMINSNPVIKFCQIYDNLGPAVLSAANGNSSPQIIGNVLVQNCASILNMPQINLGTSSATDTIAIFDNTITGFYTNSGGIAVATLAGGSIKAVIKGNVIDHNRYGITAYGMNISTRIENNVITNNNIQGDPMLGGSGINFWGDQTNISKVSGNEISGNLWGVTVQNHALPNFGQVDPDTMNPGKNLFFDNGNNGVIYALYNNTPNDLFAENNYWGTFDPDTVEMYIFHQPDEPSLGLVDYLPLKDYFTSIPEKGDDQFSSMKIFPNPARTEISFTFSGDNSNPDFFDFQILDYCGRLIIQGKISSSKKGFDISFLPEGGYYLILRSETKFLTTILLKQ
jgi:hypothetical protein